MGAGKGGVIGLVDALTYVSGELLIYAPKSIAESLYIVLDSRIYVVPMLKLLSLKSGLDDVF